MVTLRVGLGVGLAAVGGSFADRDAVADGDLLGADEDVFDEQAQYPLALCNAGGVGGVAQLGEEAFEVIGEFQVGLAVGGLGVEGVDLASKISLLGRAGRACGRGARRW